MYGDNKANCALQPRPGQSHMHKDKAEAKVEAKITAYRPRPKPKANYYIDTTLASKNWHLFLIVYNATKARTTRLRLMPKGQLGQDLDRSQLFKAEANTTINVKVTS